MATQNARRPLIARVADETSNRNFQELQRFFVELFPGVWAREREVTLITGDNAIMPSAPRPRGRIIVYQSAAANFFDKGLNASGAWVLNSSAPCTIRIAFY